MPRLRHFGRCVTRGLATLWLLLLVVAAGCGTGSYNDKLEQRIQELKTAAPESSEEGADEEASSPTPDEQPEDELDELDTQPEDEAPEESPSEDVTPDEEPPEDDVPEINEPV